MTDFITHEGAAVFVDGYASIYDTLSEPLPEYGGKRELIRPGAFDQVLRHPCPGLSCEVHHLGPSSALGSAQDGTLKVWSDSHGLAFRAGPILFTGSNAAVLKSIVRVRDGIRGCSWRAAPAEVTTEAVSGMMAKVIRKFEYLEHISVATHGVYLEAVCWCSHEFPYDLPDYLKPLARHWHDNRPARAAMLHPTAAPARRAPSRAEQAAKAHQEANARHHTRTPRRGMA